MKNLPLTSRLYVGSILAAAIALAIALAFPALVAHSGYWLAALLIPSVYLASRAHRLLLVQVGEHQRRVAKMSDLHLATMEALALAIAATQQAGHPRLGRMRVYAAGLARALGMSEIEIQGVDAAALLHDIGKLAVPEYLLWKPGPIAPEELQKIRIHAQASADILDGVPFPYPVASVIRSHHERWDGRGYPAGLAGGAIPLGARILSTIDSFEALTLEFSMTADAALERLLNERGNTLDPTVVDAFVRLYPALAAEAAEAEAIGWPSRHPTSPRHDARSASADSHPHISALDEIALAHVEFHGVFDIAQAMSRALGVHDTITILCEKLGALVPLASCGLFVPADEGTLSCRFATGVDAERIQRLTMRDGQWSTERAAANRLPRSHELVADDLDLTGDAEARTVLASALVYPLIFNDAFIGMLAVYHRDPAVYTDDHARMFGRVCDQAAAAIHHSIVFEQTQEDSLRDSLTGLPNARYLFMHLSREFARAERLRTTVSVLVLDLDGFKDINDTYGHDVGDRALRTVAGALRSVIRLYDVCVRYAGDEFVVVLTACAKEEAERKRLDLQKAIADVSFEISPGRSLALAISVGLAVFPDDGVSRETLLGTADRRMYGDKTSRKLKTHSSL